MNDARQFDGFIGPANLLSLVRNTAPWLFLSWAKDLAPTVPEPEHLIDLADQPFGWLQILRHGRRLAEDEPGTPEAHADYFALCLACHWATVASFVPTDVDTKIRDALWHPRNDRGALERMATAVLALRQWDVARISARWVDTPLGHVGGHDGEWLGVAVGALGCFLRLGDASWSERLFAAIDAELERETAAFRALRAGRGRELDLLRLAAVITHNVGDVDQGLRSWRERESHPLGLRLRHLAHENATPYGGTCQVAAALYKQLLAAEGHRHYPLREVKALRSSADFLLPFGPFFDDWGRKLGAHADFSPSARGDLLAALLAGCRKVTGQIGYYRAIAGLEDAVGNLEVLAKHLPGASQKALKDPELRRAIAVKQVSFESALKKRAAVVLADFA